jgi:hypothetical protein
VQRKVVGGGKQGLLRFTFSGFRSILRKMASNLLKEELRNRWWVTNAEMTLLLCRLITDFSSLGATAGARPACRGARTRPRAPAHPEHVHAVHVARPVLPDHGPHEQARAQEALRPRVAETDVAQVVQPRAVV